MELCGGTHTKRTGDIGLFRITGESSVAANVRRIEALTGETALRHDQTQDSNLKYAASALKSSPERLIERLDRLIKETKEKEKEIETLKARLLSKKSEDFLSKIREVGGVKVLAREMEVDSPKELREAGDRIRDRFPSGIILLGAKNEGKVMLTCMVTKDLVSRFDAGNIIKHLSRMVGGKGGGRPEMAQGGGDLPEKLEDAFEEFYNLVDQSSKEGD